MRTQDQIVVLPKNIGKSLKIKEYTNIQEDHGEDTPSIGDIEDFQNEAQGTQNTQNILKKKYVLSILFVIIVLALLAIFVLLSSDENRQPDATQTIQAKNQQEVAKQKTPKDVLPQKQKPSSEKTPINIPTQKPKDSTPKQQKVESASSKYVPVFIPITTKADVGNSGLHIAMRQHEGHPVLTFPYPTLGMPQAGKPFNTALTTEGGQQYYKYETLMDQILKPYNNTNCEYERYGDRNDGGYVVCKNFLKHSEALINVGVEGRDQFGCDVASQFLIPNFQYDCTNNRAPVCSKNNNFNHFQQICIGERSELNYYSLKDMVESRNLTKRHVTMKIDVEGSEWPGFRTFPVEYLDYVDQLVLQIHLLSKPISYNYPLYWGNIDSLKSIGDKFVSVSLHMNNHACVDDLQIQQKFRFYKSYAIEVTLVNKKLITIHQNTRSYKINPKNDINKLGARDCQLND